MDPRTLRRTGALLASAALLASLFVVTVAAPTTAAKPTCDGKAATIVSNRKIIRGTNRNDVIVAVGVKSNRIYGRGGHDRICAGKGHDIVYGGPGRDRIFGAVGRDRLYGGAANDRIDGGPGYDVCRQATGSGLLTRCEDTGAVVAPVPPPPTADLGVSVSSPATAPAGVVDFVVTVTNNGPSAVAYTLTLKNDNSDATCSGKDGGDYPMPVLAAGAQYQETIPQDCTTGGAGATVTMEVSVAHAYPDPNPANSVSSATTTFTS
jgi:hypothetical protein